MFKITGTCDLLQVGSKLACIQSDYYFDMEYCVEYSTFRTLHNSKCIYIGSKNNVHTIHAQKGENYILIRISIRCLRSS